MHRAQDAELSAHEQAHPPRDGNGRRHILPAHQTHRRSGSAPDPWSPGYQRNVHRFSLSGNSKPSHPGHHKRLSSATVTGTPPAHPEGPKRAVPLYAHHRHGSSSPSAPVRIRRKAPGIVNFFRKLNGERVRERGHKVPGFWQSMKAIVLSSCESLMISFDSASYILIWFGRRVEHTLCVFALFMDRCVDEMELCVYFHL